MTEATAIPKKVLIVDDDESLLKVCARALGLEGFEVILAKDGQEAAKLLEDHEFGVIFTDLTMPGMDGRELLRHVRQHHGGVCVNIVTGAGSIEGAVECMRLGACDYIAKPFDLKELTAMAFRCMEHYAHHREVERLKHDITAYEELDKLKSEFVSNVSHELRTPLFSIGGALELLMQTMPEFSDEAAKKLCGVMANNLNRLNSIVSNILNFSRIEKGTFLPSFRETDLKALARKSMSDLQPLFGQRGITAEPVSGAPEAKIEADPDQLEQVLINLIGNAIKFTPRGGRIGAVLTDEGEAVRLCVWDTGCGIAPEYHKKIFDRFYQVDGSLTRESGGSGIGLAIVKSIVEMHGGRVWAESAAGQGTRINIDLPKKQKKIAA
ncbi:MAG: ATP-binding protein [Elusimicrobiales bacterium]|nr:ATP-binding protein [Elusimicrobiales bacterium]